MKYKPYTFDYLEKLLQYFYRQGLYSGTHDFLTITMQGGFEAFSGRASEGWEYQFVVENHTVPEIGIKGHRSKARTINEACRKLYTMLLRNDDEGEMK